MCFVLMCTTASAEDFGICEDIVVLSTTSRGHCCCSDLTDRFSHAAKSMMGLSGRREVAETKTLPATKVRRGRKKLYKASVTSPLLDSPDSVRLEWSAAARGGPGRPVWLGLYVNNTACVSDLHRASGGKGERPPHHKETAPVQDRQEVTS